MRLTGVRWCHGEMKFFEDMMLSVERYGGTRKSYAMRLRLRRHGSASSSGAQLSSCQTHRVGLLDTLFNAQCCELRIECLAANTQSASRIGAVVVCECQRVGNHHALEGLHRARKRHIEEACMH